MNSLKVLLLISLLIGLTLPILTPSMVHAAVPTLTETPSHGIPSTNVTLAGVNFEPNAAVTVFFLGTNLTTSANPDADYIKEGTATTDSTGAFGLNFTTPVTMFGGDHYIYANSSGSAAIVKWTADEYWREVTVRQGYVVSNQTVFNQTDSFYTSGDGLHAGTGTFSGSVNFPLVNGLTYGEEQWLYMFTYDQQIMFHYINASGWFPTQLGRGTPSFRVFGEPGLHIIQYFHMAPPYQQVNPGNLPTSFYTLIITITGTPVESQVAALQNTVNGLLTTVANLQSSVTALQSSITALQSYIDTKTATTNTAVAGVGSAVAGVSSALTGVQSALGTKMDTATSSLMGSQSSLGTKVDTVSSATTGIQSSVQSSNTNVQSMQTQVNSLTTYVFVAIGLAVVAIVLQIFTLMRKK
jgi:hypothetical protein